MSKSQHGLTLINDLNNLKTKLEAMDKEIKFQTKNIGIRDKCWDEMSSTLVKTVELNKNKSDRVNIDCGGRKFTTTKTTFLNAKNSLFEAIAQDPYFDLNKEIFFDRSPDYFGAILEYIRSGQINYKLFKKEQKKKLLEEAKYFQVLEVVNYLEERLKDVELLSFEFTGPYVYKGQTAGTNILEDVKNRDLNVGGICSASPGNIVFKLNSDWEFSEIEIGGYKGDAKLWYPENGSGASIYTSEDGKEWKKVGKIPSGYGKEIKTVKLTKSVGRYIKFNHSSYLGISFLNVKKIEED
jgi:hypothetical protein